VGFELALHPINQSCLNVRLERRCWTASGHCRFRVFFWNVCPTTLANGVFFVHRSAPATQRTWHEGPNPAEMAFTAVVKPGMLLPLSAIEEML
jgi:hypothetical protein